MYAWLEFPRRNVRGQHESEEKVILVMVKSVTTMLTEILVDERPLALPPPRFAPVVLSEVGGIGGRESYV